MTVIKEAAEIEVDADSLWRQVGDFGCVAQWHPQLSGMAVADEGTGQRRTAYFKSGGEELDRLRTIDEAQHVYQYEVEHTSLPVRDYRGEFRIESVEPHRSRIVWEAQFTPMDERDERTLAVIRNFLHEGTTGIQAKYTPYVEGEARGVERGIADADKRVRAGSVNEPVRNTPPAGAWNETTSD
jgi:hypothetical protein